MKHLNLPFDHPMKAVELGCERDFGQGVAMEPHADGQRVVVVCDNQTAAEDFWSFMGAPERVAQAAYRMNGELVYALGWPDFEAAVDRGSPLMKLRLLDGKAKLAEELKKNPALAPSAHLVIGAGRPARIECVSEEVADDIAERLAGLGILGENQNRTVILQDAKRNVRPGFYFQRDTQVPSIQLRDELEAGQFARALPGCLTHGSIVRLKPNEHGRYPFDADRMTPSFHQFMRAAERELKELGPALAGLVKPQRVPPH